MAMVDYAHGSMVDRKGMLGWGSNPGRWFGVGWLRAAGEGLGGVGRRWGASKVGVTSEMD